MTRRLPLIRMTTAVAGMRLPTRTAGHRRWSRATQIVIALLALRAAPARAGMIVDSFEGAPTEHEIDSFKAEILTLKPGTGGNLTPTNDWAQHEGGSRIRAMGMVYEMTYDQEILDRMIYFCD